MRDPRSIYIASGSSEIELARSAIASVKDLGFSVTNDWTEDPGWAVALPGGVDNRPIEEKKRSALSDVKGILDAYTFWLLAPAKASRGAYTEQGIALSRLHVPWADMSGRIIVSGPQASLDLFSSIADHCFDSHDRAIGLLDAIASADFIWNK